MGVSLTNTGDGTPNERGGGRGDGRAPGKLFGVMIKVGHMPSLKCSALVDETPPLQSPLFRLGQSVPHRVVLQPLEFGSLGQQCVTPAIIK